MADRVFRDELLKGKVAFVTGGSSGINLGIAEAFVKAGAKVAINGRNVEKLEAAVKGLQAHGTAMGVAADVRDYAAVEKALQAARDAYGEIDILVCGAAGNFPAPALGMSSNGFKAVLDIDVLGTFNACRAAFEHLRKPGASVINISAPQAYLPMAMQAHVCAAKAGVDMLTRVLAIEWGGAGVRVNSITPGPIDDTEGMRRLAPSEDGRREARAAPLPLQRFGTKEDIAHLALFLASRRGLLHHRLHHGLRRRPVAAGLGLHDAGPRGLIALSLWEREGVREAAQPWLRYPLTPSCASDVPPHLQVRVPVRSQLAQRVVQPHVAGEHGRGQRLEERQSPPPRPRAPRRRRAPRPPWPAAAGRAGSGAGCPGAGAGAPCRRACARGRPAAGRPPWRRRGAGGRASGAAHSRHSRCLFRMPLRKRALALGASPIPPTEEPPGMTAPADAARLVTCPPDDFRRASEEAMEATRQGIARFKALPAPRAAREALELYDEAVAALSDASARASVVRHGHPDAAHARRPPRPPSRQLEALSTELSLDRGLYDVLASLDLSGEDAATRKCMEQAAARLPPRRRGPRRGHPRAREGAPRGAGPHRPGVQPQHPARTCARSSSSPAQLEGLPEDYVRAHAPGADGTGAHHHRLPGLRALHDLRAGRDTAREALWRAYRLRGHPKNLDVLQRHAGSAATSWRRCSATRLGGLRHRGQDDRQRAGRGGLHRADRQASARAHASATTRRCSRASARTCRAPSAWTRGTSAYLEDRVKAEQYGFDSQAVRPYFEYGRVKEGVLDMTARLFGVDATRRVQDAPVWHPDVEAYDVLRGRRRCWAASTWTCTRARASTSTPPSSRSPRGKAGQPPPGGAC